MLFSTTFFCLFPPAFSYCIQFLLLLSLNLGAAKLPIILLFVFFTIPAISAAFLESRAPVTLGLRNTSWMQEGRKEHLASVVEDRAETLHVPQCNSCTIETRHSLAQEPSERNPNALMLCYYTLWFLRQLYQPGWGGGNLSHDLWILRAHITGIVNHNCW